MNKDFYLSKRLVSVSGPSLHRVTLRGSLEEIQALIQVRQTQTSCQREGCRQSTKIHFVSYKYFHHRSSDPTTVWRSWVILVTQSTSPTTITWSPKATFSWARQPMLCSRCNFQFWKLEIDKIDLRGFIWHWRPLPPTTESTVAPVRVRCGLGWPFMLKPFSGVSTLNFPCR